MLSVSSFIKRKMSVQRFCNLLIDLFLLFIFVSTIASSVTPANAKSMRPPPGDYPVTVVDDKAQIPNAADKQLPTTQFNEEWQFFRINAQYRGAVKKSISDVGCAIAWFKDLAPDQTQVIVHVCAVHPEKEGQKFSFRLNLVLQREPGKYSLLSKIYADFSGINGDRQNQLQQLTALWAYLRHFAFDGSNLFNDFTACGVTLKLAEAARKQGRISEIDCCWPGKRSFQGKFFFEKIINAAVSSAMQLDKFRFSSGKLSISLVKDTQAAVTKDFAYRQPFATDVFK